MGAMFTTALSARTLGAARPEMVAVVSSATGMCAGATTATTVPGAISWYRHVDGFGFPVNHKRPARRPPSPNS
jgi:hypothetical protein